MYNIVLYFNITLTIWIVLKILILAFIIDALMNFTPKRLNLFSLFKLPSAYLTGVRTKSIDEQQCVVTVRHRWINQNPFKSMFWAVQGMAAELSTGALIMMKIKASQKNISMLVIKNNASFSKKAKGVITFSCAQGNLIDQALQKAIDTGEGQTLILTSKGIDALGDEVSSFDFEWSLKLKTK
jgi:hypothetical protein